MERKLFEKVKSPLLTLINVYADGSHNNKTLLTTQTSKGASFKVRISPIFVVELLFFAIFGQTTHGDFKVELDQPKWTTVLFKLTFGIYMLVSVVVLINLLIAMMSDTYQRIQAQSDIEWKYGLSKLVRNMVRTTTAPSPLNLMSTWITYLCKLCKKRFAKKPQRPSLMHLMTGTRMSPRSKMGAKWLSKVKGRQIGHKDSVALSVTHLSPLGSQLSFGNTARIDNVVDWDVVRRKYRDLYGEEVEEKPVEENKESTETNPLAALEGSNNEKSKLLGA
ncbi:short transient receptor potential channel [Lasius niger]|uniref:Short transient receptor potential channel n=1 Tax=Lasius niger TaxID=67767 RepID=A0A0J7L1R8_LASNI|nr:short transient receptor potential channel [Lasius niger]